MNFPLISEYIEAIKSAEDNFEQLKDLRPVQGDDELFLITFGILIVDFIIKDEEIMVQYVMRWLSKDTGMIL